MELTKLRLLRITSQSHLSVAAKAELPRPIVQRIKQNLLCDSACSERTNIATVKSGTFHKGDAGPETFVFANIEQTDLR